jgi:hypothetical protein
MAAFSRATADLWHNFTAVFTGEPMRWAGLARFYERVFLPYLLGGILPGLVAATAGYFVTLPLVTAYQRRRKKKLRERFERIRAAMAERAAEAARIAVRAERECAGHPADGTAEPGAAPGDGGEGPPSGQSRAPQG